MDPSLEIRKLRPSHIRELASMLETHELWKRLMTIIPKNLDKNNYQCDITSFNHYKYHSEHFRLIENEAEKTRKTCTEILFDEWGTSGRVRPALGHLLYLLTKANLYRAADYVAVDLLHQEKPKRPDVGPEAEIPVNLSEIIKPPDDEIEKILDNIDYVSDAVNLIRTASGKTPKKASKVPQIVITPDIDENINVPKLTMPTVVQTPKPAEEVSDMIKFSTTINQSLEQGMSSTNNIVETTQSNSSNASSNSINEDLNMPNISLITGKKAADEVNTESMVTTTSSESSSESSTSSHSEITNSVSTYNPAFSQIMDSSAIKNVPPENNIPQENNNVELLNDNVPNLSILNIESKCITNDSHCTVEHTSSLVNNSIENIIPDLAALQESNENIMLSNNLPDLSALQISNLNINLGGSSITAFSNTSQISSDFSLKTRSCSSPLPNLSLDTVLPQFSYQNLEAATNNFNTEQYTSQSSPGRLLGKGEFGSVFLALNLLDKPVAVKKLDIGDVEIVNIDDEVTKQFRNEVEVLSKYKHDNLLTLLGYSCDGCTYCLLYEYIPGGALRERLQDANNQLLWKERLNVAFGTSKAISYLHTALSTPLIHRDIKSANILLDSKNEPKLCDFGLIKLIPNQNFNTATTVFGTSAYMPREAFGGDISVKLDTFSFGVVLLELLTSLPPIDNNREGADLVTHIGETVINDDITPLVDYNAGSWVENSVNYADKLFKVSQCCLEEKKKRPTMLEVKMNLETIMKNLVYK